MDYAAAIWTVRGCLFFLLLAGASCYDICFRKVPDFFSFSIFILSLFTQDAGKLIGILCGIPLLLAAVFVGGIGGADIKIMAGAGMFLGLLKGLYAMVIGFTGMLFFHMCICLFYHAEKKKESYPLIPFLTIGVVLVYLLHIPKR